MSADPIECEQEDFYNRLLADEYLADVAVLLQRKGVTDSDVETALGTINERGGKLGAVAIVLMPSLTPDSPNVPGPRYTPRVTVQVIENPLFNGGDGGSGKSAESIATRVRRICHHFNNGAGIYVFAGQDPLPVDSPQVSYGVSFTRQGGDEPLAKVARPTVTPSSGAAPQEVTLACATPVAAIYYTLDGSYPSSANPEATLYTVPFNIAAAATLRVGAEKTGLQASDVTRAIFT